MKPSRARSLQSLQCGAMAKEKLSFRLPSAPCLTITTILDLYSHTTLYAYYILYTVPWLQLRSNSSISHSAEQHVAELVRPQIQGQVFGDLQRRSQSCADSWVKGGPIYALLHYIIPYYTVRSQITLLGYYIYQIILAKLSARRLVTSCLERTARNGADHYQLKASSRRYVYRYSMGVRMHVYVHIYVYRYRYTPVHMHRCVFYTHQNILFSETEAFHEINLN